MYPFLPPPPPSPFSEKLPENIPLFHYTDAGGLIGMVQHKKLWLTSIHYQNDSQEYFYTLDLVNKILREEYPGLIENNLLYSRERTSTVFTFSLSEKGDSLSQWRGYCPDGGFAINFNNEMLSKALEDKKVLIGKCIYNEKDQREFIKKHVMEFSPEYYLEARRLEKTPPNFTINHAVQQFHKRILNRIYKIAPLLKDPSFSDEAEWRLVKTLDTGSEAKSLGDSTRGYITENTVKIRAGKKNRLIPYIEVPLKVDDKAVKIDKVIVSPNPHKELALDACLALLYSENKVDNSGAIVESSNIPYINW